MQQILGICVLPRSHVQAVHLPGRAEHDDLEEELLGGFGNGFSKKATE